MLPNHVGVHLVRLTSSGQLQAPPEATEAPPEAAAAPAVEAEPAAAPDERPAAEEADAGAPGEKMRLYPATDIGLP